MSYNLFNYLAQSHEAIRKSKKLKIFLFFVALWLCAIQILGLLFLGQFLPRIEWGEGAEDIPVYSDAYA